MLRATGMAKFTRFGYMMFKMNDSKNVNDFGRNLYNHI